jgi:hypothetical protein
VESAYGLAVHVWREERRTGRRVAGRLRAVVLVFFAEVVVFAEAGFFAAAVTALALPDVVFAAGAFLAALLEVLLAAAAFRVVAFAELALAGAALAAAVLVEALFAAPALRERVVLGVDADS